MKEQLPLVSICIPNYNNAQFISKCIQSALNQSYENIEVVVVDNCSTDNSWEVISKIKNKKLKIFSNSANIGMYPNFMRAAELSSGDFIKFICADDWLDKDFVSESLKHFINEDIAMVSSKQAKFFNENGKIKGYRNVPCKRTHVASPNELFNYFLSNTNPIGNPTRVIIRKKVFYDYNGFDLDFRFCNDYELWMRISKKYRVAFIDKCLSYERKHNNQATSSYSLNGGDVEYVVKAWRKNFHQLNAGQLKVLLFGALFTFLMTNYRILRISGSYLGVNNTLKSFKLLGMGDFLRMRLLAKAFFLYLIEVFKVKIVRLKKYS